MLKKIVSATKANIRTRIIFVKEEERSCRRLVPFILAMALLGPAWLWAVRMSAECGDWRCRYLNGIM